MPTSINELTRKFWELRSLQVQPPFQDGLILLAGRWPIPKDPGSIPDPQRDLLNGGRLRFIFQDEAGEFRRIEIQGFGKLRRVTWPDGRVRTFSVSQSRIQIRILMGRGLTLSCGDVLTGSLSAAPGKLVSMEAEGPFVRQEQDERDSWRGLEVRQPLVRQLDDSVQHSAERIRELSNSIWHAADQDRVILTSGDELYGHVSEAWNAVEIASTGDESKSRRISRDQVSAVCFARPAKPDDGRVSGVFARIDLVPDASCSIGGIEEPFWIRTAMTAVTKEGFYTQHPSLGMTTVHWPMIRRIRPLFEGTYYLLDPGPRHLGNAYRESFSRIEPDGTELKFQFEMTTGQLSQPTFLSADIAELIPTAAGTLKATPFLDEVRAGGLATRVFLNGELAGMLNELIQVRASAKAPERVRLRLPIRLLKEGDNIIDVRQSSARNDSTSFDDCEIRAIAIEIEHRVDFAE